ncbi:hypothetical protein [Hugenholtzia roseola]|uniref:hypothetical protein n=1 Tax=Hugenholtzia roseola TaxID=1002 RepID=UPI000428EC34|nr:hypothetical protein [Hugenholtzia roseola]
MKWKILRAYFLGGFFSGLFLPLLALGLELFWFNPTDFEGDFILKAHLQNPLLFLIDTLPFWSALFWARLGWQRVQRLTDLEKEPSSALFSQKTFDSLRRLRWSYWGLVGLMGILLVLGQILLQSFLERQSQGANLISLAGRQRLLSQRIGKEILLLSYQKNSAYSQTQNSNIERPLTADSVEKSLASFEQAADNFISLLENLEKKTAQERDQDPQVLIENLRQYQDGFLQSGRKWLLAQSLADTLQSQQQAAYALQEFFRYEAAFLPFINSVVQKEVVWVVNRLAFLKKVEMLFLALTLIGLLLISLAIFRPILKRTEKAMRQVLENHQQLEQAHQRAATSEEELRQNVEELKTVQDTLLTQKAHLEKVVAELKATQEELERFRK